MCISLVTCNEKYHNLGQLPQTKNLLMGLGQLPQSTNLLGTLKPTLGLGQLTQTILPPTLGSCLLCVPSPLEVFGRTPKPHDKQKISLSMKLGRLSSCSPY